MRHLYSLALYLLSPLLFAYLGGRGIKAPEYRRRWGERLGRLPRVDKRPIWLHAVSVGEVQAALPLARGLLERYPAIPLVVTTATPTGSAHVRAQLGERVQTFYLPLDLPGAVKRFYQRLQPRVGIVMETELWPNLLAEAQRRRIPLLLASARLSPRSVRRYRKLHALVTPALEALAVIAAQSERDAERFRAIGAPAERVEVSGNLKLDLQLPQGLREQGQALRARIAGERPVWVAASTREGEEEQVLDAFAQVRRQVPDLLLILVPRHPERFRKVEGLLTGRGYSVLCRSAGEAAEHPAADVFLGDSLGELLLFYAAADVAFVGGSLVPIGGHNPLEPAALGLPVLMGPQLANVSSLMEQLVAAEAALVVEDRQALARALTELLTTPGRRRAMGTAGAELVAGNRGATEWLLARVDRLLATSAESPATAPAGR